MASEGGVARCWYSSNSSHFASSRTHTQTHTAFLLSVCKQNPDPSKNETEKSSDLLPREAQASQITGSSIQELLPLLLMRITKRARTIKAPLSWNIHLVLTTTLLQKQWRKETQRRLVENQLHQTHTQTHLVLPPAFQKQTNCEFWVLNSLLIIAVICSFACCLKPACWCCYSSTEFSLCFVVCVCVHMSFFVFLFFGFNSSSCICVLKCVNANISI